MITIHKYLLKLEDNQAIEMPEGAQVLCVDVQLMEDRKAYVQLWAKVDTSKDLTPYRITIRGTGHECTPQDGDYINTFFYGALVFHAFNGGMM